MEAPLSCSPAGYCNDNNRSQPNIVETKFGYSLILSVTKKHYTKLSDDHAAKSLMKFQNMLKIPAVQLVNKAGVCKVVSNGDLKIIIISADHWLSLLP